MAESYRFALSVSKAVMIKLQIADQFGMQWLPVWLESDINRYEVAKVPADLSVFGH